MKRFTKSMFVVALFVALAAHGQLSAQQPPMMPTPEKEHEWLKQFIGEWESEGECTMAPGATAVKCQGTESTRTLGGFWIVAENKSAMMGMQMQAVMMVGYDAEKKKYVGTWADSCTSHMWKYEGTVDAAGKTLTLEAEGPSMLNPGKQAKYKDVTEFKSPDHKVLTSSMLGDDGKWTTFVTINYRRKK